MGFAHAVPGPDSHVSGGPESIPGFLKALEGFSQFVQGLGFRIQGFGLGFLGLGARVWSFRDRMSHFSAPTGPTAQRVYAFTWVQQVTWYHTGSALAPNSFRVVESLPKGS